VKRRNIVILVVLVILAVLFLRRCIQQPEYMKPKEEVEPVVEPVAVEKVPAETLPAKPVAPAEITREEVPGEISKEEKISVSAKDILIDNFESGETSGVYLMRRNKIGGFQGGFAKRPSWVILSKSRDGRSGQSGKCLCIEYRKEAGWCGWYTLLNGVSAAGLNALSFWVKGKQGGEEFNIGMADKKMQDMDVDAVYAGSIDTFLKKGVTTEWQEAKVPLSRFASDINLNRLGSLVFFFNSGGQGKIYVDDVWLKDDSEIREWELLNAPRAEIDPEHPRSLWLWKLDPVRKKAARRELYYFCERVGVRNIYLYFSSLSEKKEFGYFEKVSQFLKEVHRKGLKVEALTGNPSWSLAVNHKECLNWLEPFLKYNNGKPKNEQFDGVHLDVEPYLTKDWSENRPEVTSQYLSLLSQCRKLIDRYQSDFSFGVAIPVFFNQYEDLMKGILENVDYIALMDYSDSVKSIVKGAEYHLRLAEKMKKKVVIGLETQDLIKMHQGKSGDTFFDDGWEQMENVLSEAKKEFDKSPAFLGYGMHCYYSYRFLQKERNVPKKQRPPEEEIYKIYAAMRIAEVVIDGKLNEWDFENPGATIDKAENAIYGADQWKGPRDLSGKAQAMWDKDNLYFAFSVTDNKVYQEARGGDIWTGDHIELWLDTDLDADYNEAVNSEDDIQVGFSPGNFSDIPPVVYVWTPDISIDYKKIVKIASRKTKKGYIIEAQLPINFIFSWTKDIPGKIQPDLNADMKMGISIELSDTDSTKAPQKCMLSTSLDRVWGDPTTFGFLVLEK